eukprot:TRINITY_DN90916_c0_g1_i1.p1 TRINITY_DN90916_c0_g1~~TRINITY_DN90916_c0_g1_i1.p1  ORF type:complete len:511 (+),score=107.30 TRINITY_DN90916_c0_g1_i1:22-1554(+)
MVQSLSPEETSRWCNSLAPCGVRGELLLSLQAAIRQQGVDGQRFGELLRSNALQQLRVDGLDPRLGVAIRKAWNKDFENVRFIPHASSHPAPHPTAGPGRQEPPPLAQRIRSAEKRAQAALENQSVVTAEAYNAANIACRLRQPSSDFHEGGLGDAVQPRAPAPTSYAVPEASVPRRKSPSGGTEGPSSLADIFVPKGEAPRSFAPPAAAAADPKPRLKQEDSWAGVSLGDALSSAPGRPDQRYVADRRLAGDEESGEKRQSAAPRGRRRQTCDSAWEGISLGDALGPRRPARHNFTAPSETEDLAPASIPERCHEPKVPPASADDQPWEGVSLGDALRLPQAAASQAATSPQGGGCSLPGSGRPSAADPWAGIPLGGPKAAEAGPSSVAKAAASEPRRQRGKNGAAPAAAACSKSSAEVIEWLKSLPASLVPEQPCQEIAAVVEQNGLDGTSFTEYVQSVPPEICGPKHAMKLKTAWKNVLAESEARAICRDNLDYASSQAQKGVALVC